MGEVQAPLGQWPHEIGVQPCTFLRTIHVHVMEAVHINRVCQGSQPTIHHAHSGVHHFEKNQIHRAPPDNINKTRIGTKESHCRSRALYSLLQKGHVGALGVPKG